MQEANNNNASDQKELKEAEPITADKLNVSEDISVEKIKSKKWPIIMIIVLVLAFISTSGVWVYAQYMQAIGECGSSSGVCFTILEDGAGQKKVSLANLDPNKKYRIYIKRKVNNVEIDVGDVVLDMKDTNPGGTDPLTATSCTETDGGYDIDVKGTLTYGDFEGEDSCNDPLTVLEFYCTNTGYERELYDCPAGSICANGACISTSTSPGPCTDTDGGVDIYTKGHLNWFVQSYETDDYCEDSMNVMEYSCDGENYKEESHFCPSGACINGACVKADHGAMCNNNNDCGSGYFCKPSARYGDMESYCCAANECAATIPTQGSSTTGVFNCVGTGGTDETHCVGGSPITTCFSGLWNDGLCTCATSTDAICPSPGCATSTDPDCP